MTEQIPDTDTPSESSISMRSQAEDTHLSKPVLLTFVYFVYVTFLKSGHCSRPAAASLLEFMFVNIPRVVWRLDERVQMTSVDPFSGAGEARVTVSLTVMH